MLSIGGIMRFLSLVLCGWVLFSIDALAQSPPFQSITISGDTDTKYNRVSLFEDGDAVKPIKTQEISGYNGGHYSIDVNVPGDMKQGDGYYFTDMRFWNDANQNNVKDSGEPASQCHFIMWTPASNEIQMQVYKGTTYPIKHANFYYQYTSK
jgi:hypothetical protein